MASQTQASHSPEGNTPRRPETINTRKPLQQFKTYEIDKEKLSRQEQKGKRKQEDSELQDQNEGVAKRSKEKSSLSEDERSQTPPEGSNETSRTDVLRS